MEASVLRFVNNVATTFDIKEPIIDFGGRIIQPEYFGAVGALFPGKDFKTFDLQGGDIIGDIYDTNLADESIGTALCLEVLEHLAEPQRAIDELRRVLVYGGLLVLSTPICWHIHPYPKDYWRFLPSGIEFLLRDWFVDLLTTRDSEGDTSGHVFATARKIFKKPLRNKGDIDIWLNL